MQAFCRLPRSLVLNFHSQLEFRMEQAVIVQF